MNTTPSHFQLLVGPKMMLVLFAKVATSCTCILAIPMSHAHVNSPAVGTMFDDCADGDVRLEGGFNDFSSNTSEGRIEICFNEAWGTICNTSFGITDARVACNQLIGFQSEGELCTILLTVLF